MDENQYLNQDFNPPKVAVFDPNDPESYYQLNAFYNYVINRLNLIQEWRELAGRFRYFIVMTGELGEEFTPEKIMEWREKAAKWDKFLCENKAIGTDQTLFEVEQYYTRKYAELSANLHDLNRRLEAVENYLPKLLGKRGQATREWVRQHPDLSPSSVRDATLLEIHQELRAIINRRHFHG